MICQWQDFLNVIPLRLRGVVDKQYCDSLQELRMRVGLPPTLVLQNKKIWLDTTATTDDLMFTINAASEYSPWAAETISSGYITASGGHRVGVCGTAVVKDGQICGMRNPSSVCIRVARDFDGISKEIQCSSRSLLILGRPGSGKTTLLRDIIRMRSDKFNECVSVVDERGEIFPKTQKGFCFQTGRNTDVITGCCKKVGINSVLKCMNPDTIAVDEITENDDCSALIQAGWCGVNLIATAHAENVKDLHSRPVYKPLVLTKLFENAIVLNRDKTWTLERI